MAAQDRTNEIETETTGVEVFQFEREGYFCIDRPILATHNHEEDDHVLTFNRTINLKEDGGKKKPNLKANSKKKEKKQSKKKKNKNKKQELQKDSTA